MVDGSGEDMKREHIHVCNIWRTIAIGHLIA